MVEQWKIISNYENYAISNKGRIRNLNTGKLLKHQKKQKRGGYYLFIQLCKNGKKINKNVHTLVAESFLGKKPPGHVVHHKDHNKRNPHLSNSSYETFQKNCLMRKPKK